MENIYLHGIYNSAEADQPQQSIAILEEILSTNFLLSRNLQELQYLERHRIEGFNGKDYISLCDYDLRYNFPKDFPNFTSFDLFIKRSLAIFFNKQNIQPEPLLPVPPQTSFDEAEIKRQSNPLYQNVRFSDLLDEVQVKDKISLDYMEGITIPLEFIYRRSRNLNIAKKRAIFYLNNIDELLRKYNKKNKIYAIEDFQELKTTNDIERALLKAKKNY